MDEAMAVLLATNHSTVNDNDAWRREQKLRAWQTLSNHLEADYPPFQDDNHHNDSHTQDTGSNEPSSVRTVLQNSTKTTWSAKLMDEVRSAMEDRIVVAASEGKFSSFSPDDDETEDEDDDASIDPNPAFTAADAVSETAWTAALVYAQLLGRPGAFAVGLVDMTALAALWNLLQNRWPTTVNGCDAANHGSDDEENNSVIESTTSTIAILGFRVAYEVCRIPIASREFRSGVWKVEATAVVWEGVVAALANASSTLPLLMLLQSTGGDATRKRAIGSSPKNETPVSALARSVVQMASMAIRKSFQPATALYEKDPDMEDDRDENDENTPSISSFDDNASIGSPQTKMMDSLQQRHGTVVTILRALYPILLMKKTLPSGAEAGKVAAARAASAALLGLIQVVHEDIRDHPHDWPVRYRNYSDTNNRRSSTAPNTTSTISGGGFLSSPARSEEPPTSSASTTTPKRNGRASKSASRLSLTPKLLKNKTPKTVSLSSGRQVDVPEDETSLPGPIVSALVGLLEKLSTVDGLEAASFRSHVVETICAGVCALPVPDQAYALQFFVKLCYSKVPVHRLIATEIAGKFLQESWLWSNHSPSSQKSNLAALTPTTREGRTFEISSPNGTNCVSGNISLPLAFFRALRGRLMDLIPVIRSASALAWMNWCRRIAEKFSTEFSSPVAATAVVVVLTNEAPAVLDILRQRSVEDDKVTVRRASCNALVELLMLGELVTRAVDSGFCAYHMSLCFLSEKDIYNFGTISQDSSTLTRRCAAESLTRLLIFVSQSDHHERLLSLLQRTWVAHALTMVLDTETGCVAKAVDLFEKVVLNPILSNDDDDGVSNVEFAHTKKTAWEILAIVGCGGEQGGSMGEKHSLKEALRKSIVGAASTQYTTSIFRTIISVVSSSLDAGSNHLNPNDCYKISGVWCLFDAAMSYTKDNGQINAMIRKSKINLDVLDMSWNMFFQHFQSSKTAENVKQALQRSMIFCLDVVSQLASSVDSAQTENTAKCLHSLLSKFLLPPEMICSAITALIASTIASCPKTDLRLQHRKCAMRIHSLYQDCNDKFASFNVDSDEKMLVRALFTVGELSIVGFSANGDGDKTTESTIQNCTSVVGHGLNEHPAEQLVEFVQTFMTINFPGQANTLTPDSVRAHAFVAFGKLCLRDASFAKKSLNILARELHTDSETNWMVQSNSLVILGDLCVVYTNMVDRFVPDMAGCLQAGVTDMSSDNILATPHVGSALVRKHAILLLSKLLLQDYIKWRGLLFHRFLVATVDDDDEVATLAETVLFGPLLLKQPSLFFNQFVESLFVLNRCTAHPIYQAAAVMGDGGSGNSVGFDGIVLTGDVGRLRRKRIYQMMLLKMSDEEKIGLTARIGKEVLRGALTSGSELNVIAATTSGHSSAAYEGAFNVLSDALAILTFPEIHVGKKNCTEDDDIEDPNAVINNAKRMLAAKGRLLSNVSRQHLIETLLPILCNLKSLLEASRSPLLKDLMTCLLNVYQRFKVEVQECLANDPTTLQEIVYDVQQLKKAQSQKKTPSRSRVVIVAEEH